MAHPSAAALQQMPRKAEWLFVGQAKGQEAKRTAVAERHQEQIRMMASASGTAMPSVPTTIISNAIKAESTGASARTSGPNMSRTSSPQRAFARSPKVERSKCSRQDRIVAFAAAVSHLSGHEQSEN